MDHLARARGEGNISIGSRDSLDSIASLASDDGHGGPHRPTVRHLIPPDDCDQLDDQSDGSNSSTADKSSSSSSSGGRNSPPGRTRTSRGGSPTTSTSSNSQRNSGWTKAQVVRDHKRSSLVSAVSRSSQSSAGAVSLAQLSDFGNGRAMAMSGLGSGGGPAHGHPGRRSDTGDDINNKSEQYQCKFNRSGRRRSARLQPRCLLGRRVPPSRFQLLRLVPVVPAELPTTTTTTTSPTPAQVRPGPRLGPRPATGPIVRRQRGQRWGGTATPARRAPRPAPRDRCTPVGCWASAASGPGVVCSPRRQVGMRLRRNLGLLRNRRLQPPVDCWGRASAWAGPLDSAAASAWVAIDLPAAVVVSGVSELRLRLRLWLHSSRRRRRYRTPGNIHSHNNKINSSSNNNNNIKTTFRTLLPT